MSAEEDAPVCKVKAKVMRDIISTSSHVTILLMVLDMKMIPLLLVTDATADSRKQTETAGDSIFENTLSVKVIIILIPVAVTDAVVILPPEIHAASIMGTINIIV